MSFFEFWQSNHTLPNNNYRNSGHAKPKRGNNPHLRTTNNGRPQAVGHYSLPKIPYNNSNNNNNNVINSNLQKQQQQRLHGKGWQLIIKQIKRYRDISLIIILTLRGSAFLHILCSRYYLCCWLSIDVIASTDMIIWWFHLEKGNNLRRS